MVGEIIRFNFRGGKVMKVFISQPMRGLTNTQIKEQRDEAIRYVSERYDEEVEVIDSFFENAPANVKPLWYLAKSLELMSTADLCLFIGDWYRYRGCMIEFSCAQQYGYQCDYFNAFTNKEEK